MQEFKLWKQVLMNQRKLLPLPPKGTQCCHLASSSAIILQNSGKQVDSGPHEYIREFVQHLFVEKGHNEQPSTPQQDDIYKVKVEVANFEGQLDAKAFVD